MSPLLQLLVGLVVLTVGAELLVRGSSALALRLGLSPLVVGLTVVAFGTSAPELVVSVQAAQRGSAAIAVANVIGSNLCNLALILGLCALARPLTANHAVIRREVPLLIAATLGASLLLLDHTLGRFEGALLLGCLIALTVTTLRRARQETDQSYDHRPTRSPRLPLALLLTAGGLGLMVMGSDQFVDGAIIIARELGWSEKLIGLTIVAIGTSLPELAASFVAVLKGENDVAIGNVVGSSIFNLLGILGVTGLVQAIHLPELSLLDLGVLTGVTISVLPLVSSGGRITRAEGAGLLVVYFAYVTAALLD